MTDLDKALLRNLTTQANRLDMLGFIKWMLDNFITRNYDQIDWVREVCRVAADADFEQIYTKLKQNDTHSN